MVTAVTVTVVATMAFVVTIPAIPAFIILPAVLALRAVCLAGAILAGTVLATAFYFLSLTLFLLVLSGKNSKRQCGKSQKAT